MWPVDHGGPAAVATRLASRVVLALLASVRRIPQFAKKNNELAATFGLQTSACASGI